MDTLHYEPRSFHSPQASRVFHDKRPRAIDDMNLSELEVFMLRGRRLQAQAMGGVLRSLFAKLGRLLRRSDHGTAGHHPSHHPDCHHPA
jgi:hypothetical protein